MKLTQRLVWIGLWFSVFAVRLWGQVPVITLQPPLNVFAVPGDSVTLNVAATGEVIYLWRFNGFNIPGKSGPTLTIPSVSPADAGSYSVYIAAFGGKSVVSQICVLEVNGPGAAVNFSNSGLGQRVFESDGVTPLTGDGYFAQLYAGTNATVLRPVGAVTPFQTGNGSGFWRGAVRNIPGIAPGAPAVVQVRVWENGRGRTFEQGLTVNSKVGASAYLYLPSTGGVGEPPSLPSPLTGLTSFRVGDQVQLAITKQPSAVETTVGQSVNLRVEVTGNATPDYQWQRNGVDIPGARGPILAIAAATTADAGTYRVQVTDFTGTLLSDSAVLGVNESGGTVSFDNAVLRMRVTGPEGTIGLSGDAYLAQLYAGPSSDQLLPVSAAVPFNTESSAGYWRGGIRFIPGIPPGASAVVQARVWETSAGKTFEAAFGAGRPVGLSKVLRLTLGGAGSPPSAAVRMTGLQPFSVRPPAIPQLTQPLRVAFAGVGQAFQLTVRASGAEPLFYEWRKNGVLIATTTDRVLEPSLALLATPGDYQVTVRNLVGAVSSATVNLPAYTPPVLTASPTPLELPAGAAAVFSVAVVGSSPVTYQWRRNDADLPGGNDATFRIDSVQAADAGVYSVLVLNPVGVIVSEPVTLRVLTPPVITTEPVSVLSPEGSPVTLSVSATGTEPLGYQWEFNGRTIPGANQREYTMPTVGGAAAGSYRVRISNGVGAALSRFAVVQVALSGGLVQFSNVGRQAPVTGVDGVTLLAGDEALAQLYVGATLDTLQPVPGAVPFGSGNAAGLWRGGTWPVPFLPAATSAFAQVRVWATSAGVSFEEAVAAGRPVGVSAAVPVVLGGAGIPPTLPAPLIGLLPFSLTQWTPPAVVVAPVSATLVEGQGLHLTVVATGTGPLRYLWWRDATRMTSTNETLEVPSVTVADAGNYRVEVSNWVGDATSPMAVVHVASPPRILTQPVSQTLLIGALARLEVAASGSPPLRFQWLKDGVEIPGADAANYEIPAVNSSDAGGYRVRLSNEAGVVLSELAEWIVVVPPQILQQPMSQTVTVGGQVTWSVAVTGSTPLIYQWLKNGEVIDGATSVALVLPAVTALDAGIYQVRVSNAYGVVLSDEAALSVDAPVNLSGTAVDGYIFGAIVFLDTNRNGLLDPGEPWTTTDRQGHFQLDLSLAHYDRNHNGRIDASEGRLVRLGGVDLATGLAAELPATGPVESKALGPLSSLVDAVQAGNRGLTLREAEQAVAVGLNLPVDLPITQIDPLAAAVAGQDVAKKLVSAAAQVQDTLIQVGSMIDAGSRGSASANATVLDALARSLAQAVPIDLTASTAIQGLIQKSAEREGVKLPPGVLDTAAQIVAEGNQSKADATQSGDAVQVAEKISRMQSVAQKGTADDLAAVVAGLASETEVLARNTGGSLALKVQGAVGGDLFGTEIRVGTFAFGPDVPRWLENGKVIQPLVVNRTDGNRGAVRVRISLVADTAHAGTDFKPGETFLDFADGEISQSVDLSSFLIDDDVPEPAESFTAALSLAADAPAGAKLGNRITTPVEIEDDDAPGTFDFTSGTLEVVEDGRVVQRLFVERGNGFKGSVAVEVRAKATGGSASPGRDFDATPIRLMFAPGQRMAQVVVPILPDDLYEPNETAELELALAEPSLVGAGVGPHRKAQLLIVNDDRRMPQLRVALRAGRAGEPIQLQVSGPAGQPFAIDETADLTQWKRLPDGLIGEGGSALLNLAPDVTGRFYRIQAKP